MYAKRILRITLMMLVALLIVLALPQQLRGTEFGMVTGKVVSSERAPVPGAVVEIEELALSAIANQAGEFAFRNLPFQRLTFAAKAPGFFPSAAVKIDLARRSAYQLEITIVEQFLAQSVVVTGTGTEYVAMDAPVRTQFVPASHSERNVSRTLGEALTSSVSGVRIETTCQNCGVQTVRLNGLEGNYTQVLEDGLPSMSNVTMVYALDQLPADLFETIEVVKGGASALYGPNAVAGVINLIRKEPKSNLFQFDSQAGWQHGRPEQSLGLMAQSNKLPGGMSGDFHFRSLRRTPIDRDNDGFTEHAKREMEGGAGTLYRRFFGGRARLTLGGGTFTEFRRGGDNLDLKPEQTQITEMIDSLRSSGLLRWNHTISAATFYTLSASLSYLRRETYYGAGFDPNAYGNTGNPLVTTDAQFGRQVGKHTLLGGFQHQREQVRDRIPAYQRSFNQVFRNTGGYFQDEFRVTPAVVVVAGMRSDRSNVLDHWVFSPRGNIRIGIGDKWRARFGVSTGFRAPVIFDEDLHVAAVGGQGFLLENSPGLSEEKSLSVTSSLDYLGTVGGLPLQAGVTFFSTSLRDVHVFKEVPVSGGEFRKLLRVNGGGSQVRGVEFDLNWHLRPRLALRGGGSLQMARYDEPEPQFSSRRFLRTPNRYGFAGLDLSLPKGFSLLTALDLTGSMLVPHYAGFIPEDRLETSKTFKVWDVVLDRTFAPGKNDRVKVRLYARCSNLLDDYQPDLDRGPLRDASYFYGPGNMRGVVVGTTVTFR